MASVTDHFWEFMLLWVRIFKVLRTKSLTFGTKALVCVLILCFYLLQWPNFILGSNIFWKEGQRLEWKDIPEVKGTTACSSKGPKFSFQYLCNILLSLYFPFHGLWCSPPPLAPGTHVMHKHTYKQNTHTREVKIENVKGVKFTHINVRVCMWKRRKRTKGDEGKGMKERVIWPADDHNVFNPKFVNITFLKSFY